MKLKRIPSICVSVFDEDVKTLVEKVNEIDADLIEIRADYIKNINIETIKFLIENIDNDNPKIFTLRSKIEGGFYNGDEFSRIKLISKAIGNFELIDIEISTREEYLKNIIKEAKENDTDVIISYHNFKETPDENILKSIIDKERNLGANICKVATHMKDGRDLLKMFKILLEYNNNDLCLLGMGDIGMITRILFPYFGSVIVYSYYDRPTAKGQLHVDDMKYIFNILNI